MKSRFRYLFLVCSLAIAGVMALQFMWIRNYYAVNKERFEKDVNLAFEDAIKKEFELRCDTLEALLYDYIIDSSKINIKSNWSEKFQRYIYHVVQKDTNDRTSFSMKGLDKPILSYRDSTYLAVARQFARMYREEDLERHVIFYKTQELGSFIGQKAQEEYNFDTSRLRPVLQQQLATRDIFEPFHFALRDSDNTLNRNVFPDSIQKKYAVISKSFPTYRNEAGKNFVRVMFASPRNYLFRKMIWMLVTSVVLLLVLGILLFYLINVIRREKRLSAIKNDFINNMSHELKTPVATVAAAIEAIEHFNIAENPARTKRYLDISKNELQRLNDMVNKILNISIYEKQAFELKPEMVNVNDLVNEIIAMHAMSADKEIQFHYTNDTNTTEIKADRMHLHSAVNNLVENAVKYSDAIVDISISFSLLDGYHVITVSDNGPGIPKQHLPFVFDKFYRVPTGNLYKIKGYGLGLCYVKNIMTKHGGWCTAESKPGNGAIFKLGFIS